MIAAENRAATALPELCLLQASGPKKACRYHYSVFIAFLVSSIHRSSNPKIFDSVVIKRRPGNKCFG